MRSVALFWLGCLPCFLPKSCSTSVLRTGRRSGWLERTWATSTFSGPSHVKRRVDVLAGVVGRGIGGRTIINHGIELWVDADANSNTGFSAEGMGVELVFDFHEAELRRYNANGTVSILTFNDVGLHQAPTYSGEEVELALDQGLAGLATLLFVGNG